MFDVGNIVPSGGLLLIGLFLFAEVGLFLGFFLPGDTLLITAGVYASQGKMPLIGIMIVAAIAAVAGDNTAYFIGRKVGRGIFRKKDSIFFDPKHVAKAEKYYDKYGSKTVLIAHYMPVIRTFTPLLGGVARMPYKKFLIFDAIGDTSWAIALTLLGYYLGRKIPNIDHYVLYAVAFVVIASITPTIYHLVRQSYKKRAKHT
ncbi:MAG: DedA family protein [Candidatus Saccharibacteria bacterium]